MGRRHAGIRREIGTRAGQRLEIERHVGGTIDREVRRATAVLGRGQRAVEAARERLVAGGAVERDAQERALEGIREHEPLAVAEDAEIAVAVAVPVGHERLVAGSPPSRATGKVDAPRKLRIPQARAIDDALGDAVAVEVAQHGDVARLAAEDVDAVGDAVAVAYSYTTPHFGRLQDRHGRRRRHRPGAERHLARRRSNTSRQARRPGRSRRSRRPRGRSRCRRGRRRPCRRRARAPARTQGRRTCDSECCHRRSRGTEPLYADGRRPRSSGSPARAEPLPRIAAASPIRTRVLTILNVNAVRCRRNLGPVRPSHRDRSRGGRPRDYAISGAISLDIRIGLPPGGSWREPADGAGRIPSGPA